MSENKTILSPMQRLLGEDFNPALLMIMVRKSLIWCILIMLVTVSSSLLYLRYTPPVYEVNAALIVKPTNTAQALDIPIIGSAGKGSNLDIDKDIQIMRSNVILDRVIDTLNLGISYFLAGKILNEELYPNPPFTVSLEKSDDNISNYPIRFRILNNQQYQINFVPGSSSEISLSMEVMAIPFCSLKSVI